MAHQSRIYVDKCAEGPVYNGKSWETAFTNLHDALAISDYGDSIWIAEGTYYPSSENDRLVSFNLKNGVKIFGGFAGDEEELGQRNWQENPTILSGDIGIAGDSLDNSFHIIQAKGTDRNTLIDGLVISRGNADGTAFDTRYGGGIFLSNVAEVDSTFLIIRNCTFFDNVGRDGGAVACNSLGTNPVMAEFYNCSFLLNRAINSGGAIFREGDDFYTDTLRIVDCEFRKNYSWTGGGALFFNDFCQPLILKRSSFEQNTCFTDGGVIGLLAYCSRGYLEVDSCLFTQNIAGGSGAILFAFANSSGDNDTVKVLVRHSSFIGNESLNSEGGGILFTTFNAQSFVDISHCQFIGNFCHSNGSGVFLYSAFNNHSFNRISHCSFIQNETNDPLGGVIWVTGQLNSLLRSHNIIGNCLLTENRGGIFINSSKPGVAESWITNCTFFNNGEVDIFKNWAPDFDYVDYYNEVV